MSAERRNIPSLNPIHPPPVILNSKDGFDRGEARIERRIRNIVPARNLGPYIFGSPLTISKPTDKKNAGIKRLPIPKREIRLVAIWAPTGPMIFLWENPFVQSSGLTFQKERIAIKNMMEMPKKAIPKIIDLVFTT